jgi:glycerate kinase
VSARIVCAPASLKGVVDAPRAAALLAEGVSRIPGKVAEAVPVADGGEGTAAVLAAALGGEWHEARVHGPLGAEVTARRLLLPGGTAVVESAAAIGLPLLRPDELDPMRASSRGLGELILTALAERPERLLVCLGGSATVDGGAGLREVLTAPPPVPMTVACDVRNPLLGPRGAARAFGPQKGASPQQVEELEARLGAMPELSPSADLPGAGAAGGLGAALAALGGELVPGAPLVLRLIGFDQRLAGARLVVTGEGTMDAGSAEGKAPGEVARAAQHAGVDCVAFAGRVVEPLPGVRVEALSGDPARAADDLRALGERLARDLDDAA